MVSWKPILFSISVAAVGFYSLYRKRRTIRRRSIQKKEIQIPNSCVPYVLGTYGCAVKTLQERCSLQIKFLSPGLFAGETTCIVKGDIKNVKLAECIIKSIMRNYQSVKKNSTEIYKIFENLVNSENSNTIFQKENGSKIFAEILKLTERNIYDSNFQEQNAIIPDLQYELVKNISDFNDHTQKLHSVGGDNLIPVYVSAVLHPTQFWVQATKTKEHIELDLLTQDLFDFYDFNPDCNHPPAFETIKIGNIYAVFVNEDQKWYRAEIIRIDQQDQTNCLNSIIDVYFLDYGETLYTQLKNLRILPVEYLELKFQAIECGLANIKSTLAEWPEEAIVLFEELTHSARWYTLHARVEYNITKEYQSSYIVPYLTLIDTNVEDLNINNEMVNKGYAKYIS